MDMASTIGDRIPICANQFGRYLSIYWLVQMLQASSPYYATRNMHALMHLSLPYQAMQISIQNTGHHMTNSAPSEYRILAFDGLQPFNNHFSLVSFHALRRRIAQIAFQIVRVVKER